MTSRDKPPLVGAVRLITVVLLGLGWEWLARSGLLYEGVVPTVGAVAGALWREVSGAELYRHLAITGAEVGAGFVIGVSGGTAAGILLGAFPFAGRVMQPYVNALATTPKIIFLPIAMILFGVGPASKVALGALSGFFPVVLSTAAGMLQIRAVHIKVGRAFNFSGAQMVTKVYLPSLVWPLITGMRLGLGVTVIGVLLGEVKLSSGGLGFMAINYYNHFQIAGLYALLILIFLLAVSANMLMTAIGNRLARGPS
ncbi:MAG: ABC transporter permease [bacterium]